MSFNTNTRNHAERDNYVMSRPTRITSGKCPHPDRDDPCPMTCRYNHFERDELVIDAWELKCSDCGLRETIGYRNDEMEPDEHVEPRTCPFCHKSGLVSGTNPCEQ